MSRARRTPTWLSVRSRIPIHGQNLARGGAGGGWEEGEPWS